MNNFIFDVDGTLTPSRDKIDFKFGEWFKKFQQQNNIFLVTGSDRSKTIEQVGAEIFNFARRVYNCSGSEVWEQDKKVYSSEWELPMYVRWWLEKHLDASAFPVKTGLHIEERPGMVNFSIVGRNADRDQRKFGKFTVGTNLMVISEEEGRKDNPDYFFILPWHLTDFFVEREKEYLQNGGKFIQAFPSLRIIDKDNIK